MGKSCSTMALESCAQNYFKSHIINNLQITINTYIYATDALKVARNEDLLFLSLTSFYLAS